MRRLFLLLSLLVLAACTAQLKASNSLTQRGFVDKTGYQIGQVLVWDATSSRLLEGPTLRAGSRFLNDKRGTDLNVEFATSLTFAGGIDLNPTQQADLQNEVTSLTRVRLKDAVVRDIDDLITAIVDDWNARPATWRNELGLPQSGAPNSPLHIAVVSKQTLARQLTIFVGNSAAGNNTFTSSVIGPNGRIKYKIVDTAAFSSGAAGEARVPVFFDVTILRISSDETGNPRFSQLSIDPAVRSAITSYLAR